MDKDNNTNNSHSSSFQDAQGHWYSHLTSPTASLLTTTTSSTPSMTTDQEIYPLQSEIICVSSDDNNCDEEQQQTTSILSQEWLPLVTSTPLPAATAHIQRSEQEIENALFKNIEQLVREFLSGPYRQYPYYRVMRWTIGEQPKIEHVVTVVINRPTIIL